MAVFNNLFRNSPIASVEFTPLPEGNKSFFHLRDESKKSLLIDQLHLLGQDVLAQSSIGGKTVLITRGAKTQDELTAALASHGNMLQPELIKEPFRPWKWRGNLSILGQSMQLTSSVLRGKVDGALATFAITNLLANGINIIFGAQHTKDTHQLATLKQKYNDKLREYVKDDTQLPSLNEDRVGFRNETAPPQTSGQKIRAFVQRYSVLGGEIGLRYFGTFALSYPITKRPTPTSDSEFMWPKAAKQLVKGKFAEAHETVANTDPANFKGGWLMLIGKTIGFASKTPDPYDPKAKGFINWLRANVTFKAASVIEAGGAAVMAHDSFKNKKIEFKGKWWPKFLKREHLPEAMRKWPDFVGGIGNVIFIVGYAIRLFAPFGVKDMDMKELNAHITDGLAKAPRDELPQLVADIAADIRNHFKGKPLPYSQIYTQLTDDLYRFHGIAMDSKPAQGMISGKAPDHDISEKHFANPALKKSAPIAAMQQSSLHQDRLSSEPSIVTSRA